MYFVLERFVGGLATIFPITSVIESNVSFNHNVNHVKDVVN